MKPKKTAEVNGPTYLTSADAQELIGDIVREATRALARDLEKHLKDIDDRLRSLEGR